MYYIHQNLVLRPWPHSIIPTFSIICKLVHSHTRFCLEWTQLLVCLSHFLKMLGPDDNLWFLSYLFSCNHSSSPHIWTFSQFIVDLEPGCFWCQLFLLINLCKILRGPMFCCAQQVNICVTSCPVWSCTRHFVIYI